MKRLFAYEVEEKSVHTPGDGDNTYSLFLELAEDGRLKVKLAYLTTSNGRQWREHFIRQSEADCLELAVYLSPAKAAGLAESIERAVPKRAAFSWVLKRLRRFGTLLLLCVLLLPSILIAMGGR